MNKDIRYHIDSLVGDKNIDRDTKISILVGWEQMIVDKNSNVLMDKYKAEKHFKYLDIIHAAIKELDLGK